MAKKFMKTRIKNEVSCYVCLKKLGFSKLNYNSNIKGQERYVCLPTTENNLCNSVLRDLADDRICMSECCSTGKMSSFDIQDCIQKVKNNYYIPKYNNHLKNLLQKVGRI